jgi:release factor glutamine methyltransferase
LPTSISSDAPTLGEALRAAEQTLTAASIDNPGLDARVLVAHVLKLDRAQLLSRSKDPITSDERQAVDAIISRRAAHEPVSRILGSKEFWSLDFSINEATLVPRPESETLVEMALAALPDKFKPSRILDLGTGSGCLLLALLHELPKATGLGIDKAERAVEQARENADALDLTERARFRENDWVSGIDERFDLIVSNPPYIAAGEIAALMPEVRDHDPHLALVGGADGLDVYRFLLPRLPALLNPDGIAIVEIGEGQARAVQDLFRAAGFGDVATQRDLSGTERCIAASLIKAQV